jgi:hypothetical protein
LNLSPLEFLLDTLLYKSLDSGGALLLDHSCFDLSLAPLAFHFGETFNFVHLAPVLATSG